MNEDLVRYKVHPSFPNLGAGPKGAPQGSAVVAGVLMALEEVADEEIRKTRSSLLKSWEFVRGCTCIILGTYSP